MVVRVHDGVPPALESALLSWLPTSEFAVSLREDAGRSVELGDADALPVVAALVVEDRPTLSGARVLVACAAAADDAGATHVEVGAIDRLAAAVAVDDEDHVEVVGPTALARPLADALAARLGGGVSLVLGERFMVATEVVHPTVRGAARRATTSDHPVLARWLHAFAVEALGVTDEWGETWAEAVDNPSWELWVWEVDGALVSMVNRRPTTPTSSRIGPVYTPPAERGNGYAGGLTAAVAAALLDRGDSHVSLFTDDTNATSNALYARVGFRDRGAQGAWSVRRG